MTTLEIRKITPEESQPRSAAVDLAALADRTLAILREHGGAGEMKVADALMLAIEEDAAAKAAWLANTLDVKAIASKVALLASAVAREEEPMTKRRETMIYKDVVRAKLLRDVVPEIQKRRPELTDAQAELEAWQTPEGRDAWPEYTAPDAHLPVDEVVAKRRATARLAKQLAPLGAIHPDEAVAILAEAHSPKPQDRAGGFEWVRKNAPNLWALYEAQTNRTYA